MRLAFLRDVDANLVIHESLGVGTRWGIGPTQGLSYEMARQSNENRVVPSMNFGSTTLLHEFSQYSVSLYPGTFPRSGFHPRPMQSIDDTRQI